MRRVRLSVAVSVDGYIAGPHGESDWILMDPDIDFGALMDSFDSVLMGRKSWEAAGRGGGMSRMKAFVFSRSLRQEDAPGVTVSDDVSGTVTALKEASGKDIWLFGGGELFRSMLELGLVDSVELAVIPVFLGAGIPLLPQPAQQRRLRLVGQRLYPKTGTVLLEYAPV